MNPQDYINFHKEDILINCTHENGFSESQAHEFFDIICENIRSIEKYRSSEKRTGAIIDELIVSSKKRHSKDTVWGNKYEIIMVWILKAIKDDKSYQWAQKKLGQFHLSKDLQIDDPLKIMPDAELKELIEGKNNQEVAVPEAKEEVLQNQTSSFNSETPKNLEQLGTIIIQKQEPVAKTSGDKLKQKHIIENNLQMKEIYDICKEAFDPDYYLFREGIEYANFNKLKIKKKTVFQEMIYRLTTIMDKEWYTDVCENMSWKKSVVSGKGKKLESHKIIKKLDRILPRPKK
jgi:hypothetical protein